jgi:hypothetical protein
MPLTHILVDFENVQPSAVDIGLVRGDELRLCIFRGPGQMKYAADVAEAWQPLGAHVTFVRCAKAGRNAVDMHIAFHLGALVAEQQRAAASSRELPKMVIVSRDTDFDPLLLHIRALGFEAQRVATLRAALGAQAAAPSAPRAAVAKKTSRKTAAKKTPGAKAAPAAKAARKVPAKTPTIAKESAKESAAEPKQVVLDSLRKLGERRPNKRAGLERHIESHLGRKFDMDAVRALIAQIERDGWLKIADNKVEYTLPKARR